MAKKKANRKKRVMAAEPAVKFDDSKYDNVRFSATYDYGELALSKAASYLAGQKAKVASLILSIASLALMIVVLIADSNNLGPALVLLVLSMVGTVLTTNWHTLQIRYARGTTLDTLGGPSRRHVVVTDDAVHCVAPDGSEDVFALSDLRTVSADDDGLLAGFGNKRYAYVPAASMSASRFQELVQELEAAR